MDRNRKLLLNKIEKTKFVLFELRLYLDTHPTDIQAITHYKHYEKKLDEIIKEYEKIYGPLASKFTGTSDRWIWCDGPWPWEREYNEI